ncbi:MAG TPA: hypothetical protein VHG08_00330 [Longimicrobium sp.]|nr:hypothetical protein [Longimicrobium sp.]
MKKAAAGFVATVATVALAGTAQAQICAGYPTGDRGMYFGGRADFPENVSSFGVEANYNFSGPLGFYGGLNVISTDNDAANDDSEDELFAGVAFELASLGLVVGRVSVCPVAELRNMDLGDDSYTEIPIGLGVGGGLGVPGVAVSGYVQPQVVISQIDIGAVDETETNFGIKAGANIGFGLLSVGGEVRHLFISDTEDLIGAVPGRDETIFGIRFGIRL